jgi:hypothetical protein
VRRIPAAPAPPEPPWCPLARRETRRAELKQEHKNSLSHREMNNGRESGGKLPRKVFFCVSFLLFVYFLRFE